MIDRLIRLKREYGDFILNSKLILKLMKSAECSSVTSRCAVSEAIVSFDAGGNRKVPCVMGPTADCGRCGCIVPFAFEAVQRRLDWDSFRTVKRIYGGGFKTSGVGPDNSEKATAWKRVSGQTPY